MPGRGVSFGELSLTSERFRSLWARHDVREKTHGTKRFVHPQVGELTLHYETFAVAGSSGQVLSVYTPTRAARPRGVGTAVEQRGGRNR